MANSHWVIPETGLPPIAERSYCLTAGLSKTQDLLFGRVLDIFAVGFCFLDKFIMDRR